MYTTHIKAIFSIVNPLSINKPNTAVPKAVANTMKEVVKALILPIYFTPYISAHVEEPNKLARPFDMPIRPRKTKAEYDESKYINTNVESNKGIFMYINNFLLVNLSTKNPEIIKVKTENIEYDIKD